jgi:hypothetical protein
LRLLASEDPGYPDEKTIESLVQHRLLEFTGFEPLDAPRSSSVLDVVKYAIQKALLNGGYSDLADLEELVKVKIHNVFQTNAKLSLEGNLAELLSEWDKIFKTLVRDARCEAFLSIKDEELRNALIKSVGSPSPGEESVRVFLRARQRKRFLRNLTREEAMALSKALHAMPTVKLMVLGELGDKELAMKRSSLALRWLTPSVSGDILDKETYALIKEAMIRILNMVAPEILERLSPPKIMVNPNPDKLKAIRELRLSDLGGFRAFANRDSREVHIAVREPVHIIIHELGHQFEFALPLALWLDIQQLLRMRHRQEVDSTDGQDKLVSIYPYMIFKEVREEPRFRAKMPVTDGYSAKFYRDGATEVMSMGMEFLCRSETAAKLIDGDPLLAAIILRAIQPKEFELSIPSHLQELLPQYDLGGEYEEDADFDDSEYIVRGRAAMGRVKIIEDYFSPPKQVEDSNPLIPVQRDRAEVPVRQEAEIPLLEVGDSIIFLAPNGRETRMRVTAINQASLENGQRVAHFYAKDPESSNYVVAPCYKDYNLTWRLG